MPSLRTVLVVGEAGALAEDVLSFDVALARQPVDRLTSGRRIARDDIASCFHTGGTTGLPKVARHTHMNQLANAWAIGMMVGLTADDTLLCGLPMFHVNGVVVTGIAPFMAGAKVVMLGADGFRSRKAIPQFWRSVERFRATVFSAVPTIYSTLLGIPTEGANLSSLRYAICGAAPMPPELIRKFEETTGLSILEGYRTGRSVPPRPRRAAAPGIRAQRQLVRAALRPHRKRRSPAGHARAGGGLHALRPRRGSCRPSQRGDRLGPEDGYVHAAFEAQDVDALGAGAEWLQRQGWVKSWGIGRHVLGSQLFCYHDDPHGFAVEHYADGDIFDSALSDGLARGGQGRAVPVGTGSAGALHRHRA